MRKTLILVLSAALLLLVDCQSDEEQPTATAVPVAEPTQEPTTMPPTEVPTEVEAVPEADNLDSLLANSWQWITFQGAAESFTVENPQAYLLTFNADGTLVVKADCNNALGEYSADNSNLTISLGPTTLAVCPEGSRSEQFLRLLPGAAKYSFEGTELMIELMVDGGSLLFAPSSIAAVQPTAVPPTAPPPTATPVPPSTATPVPPPTAPPTVLPQLPGTVVDSGPRQYASGVYVAPYYTVAAGDTLFSIGQRFGVPIDQIAAANGLVNNAIYPGQQLLISSGSGVTSPPVGAQYERVTFEAGGISATLQGVIVQGQPKGYVLGGRAGQVLEIGTTSNGEALEVTVQAANGSVLTLNGENGKIQNNLYVSLPEIGDYFVTIKPVSQPENPNLAFTVTFIVQ